MSTKPVLLVRLAVVALAAVLTGGAWAATPISSCGLDLDRPGETYYLTRDLAGSPSCLVIRADGVTVDLQGFTILGQGSGTSSGSGIIALPYTPSAPPLRGAVVRNGVIKDTVIALSLATDALVEDIEISTRTRSGISVGARSTVRNNDLTGPFSSAISVGNGSTVVNNVVDGEIATPNSSPPGLVQCWNGSPSDGGCTITNNTLTKSDSNGIVVWAANSYVTANDIQQVNKGIYVWSGPAVVQGNTVHDNRGNGIEVAGPGSKLLNNQVHSNRSFGIETVCPARLSGNVLSNNGAGDYNLIGSGCRF